ncbi:MAG: peptidoglycan recognition family protein [Cyanobacteria bacterium]|nr:peptidoglycan recognition family protein [Cyanobacteriota bacterium]
MGQRQTWQWTGILGGALTLLLALFGPSFHRLMAVDTVTGLPEMGHAVIASLIPADAQASQDFVSTSPIQVAQTAPNYQPRQEIALADPSNYGDRYSTDAYGNPVSNAFIAVLHETVGSAQSAINLFSNYHANDADQVSYHTLIGLNGTIYYIVPPENRAYGAGNSVFDGPNGPETVRTNPNFPPSVNNFAYHISFETPSDGRGNGRSHSGYTQAQYESAAWLLSNSNIPDNRITTHQRVDRSGSRLDPRSFDFNYFFTLLHRYPSRAGLSG